MVPKHRDRDIKIEQDLTKNFIDVLFNLTGTLSLQIYDKFTQNIALLLSYANVSDYV